MRRLTLALVLLVLAGGAVAQVASDKQQRQRMDWAIQRAVSLQSAIELRIDEMEVAVQSGYLPGPRLTEMRALRDVAVAQISHLRVVREAIHARIVADSIAHLPPLEFALFVVPATGLTSAPTAPPEVINMTVGQSAVLCAHALVGGQWLPADEAYDWAVTGPLALGAHPQLHCATVTATEPTALRLAPGSWRVLL